MSYQHQHQHEQAGHLAPALPAVQEGQATQPVHQNSTDVHATDYGMTGGHHTPGSHTPAHGSHYPTGEPMHQNTSAHGAPLSALHHPTGVADPLAPYYPGARRSKQKQVTGLARAMPTFEEMELKKAAEKRRKEGYPEGYERGTTLVGAGTVQALDSIQDPNLRIVLGEILGALHGSGNGAMTPYTMSPPLSRMQTRENQVAPLAQLSRVPTALSVRDIAQADAMLLPEDEEAPNPIKKYMEYIREPAAELIGTALILLFGNGVNQQFFLSSNPDVSGIVRGTYLSVSFGWGIGVMVGVYVAGGISGAHLNPAVTTTLAVYRKFPWKKVPGYILAQTLGAMAGSGIVHLLYSRATSIYEGGAGIRTVLGARSTAFLYTTSPLGYMSPAASFFNEFVDTAILLCVIFAIGDSNNTPPPDGMAPIVLLFLILGIGACLGSQTAYAINPARDLGPRLMLWMAGYGTELWTAFNWYWIWCPIAAPLLGGLVGGLVYDLFLYKGKESPLNRVWGNKKQRQHPEAGMTEVDSNEKIKA